MDIMFDDTGYITIGYYRTGSETVGESARNMTARLAEISSITSSSKVLDLGCGKGAPALDIAATTGATVVGVDLADGHVERANQYLASYKERYPDIRAEFHCGSYYEIPEAVKSLAPFTHVVMQTSIFYAHHRIDDVLREVSGVLEPGSGVLVTTDFLRKVPLEDVSEFMRLNSMNTVLSRDEMEGALKRNGLVYSGGEDLDSHCIKCNIAKRGKVTEFKLEGPDPAFFKAREEFVRDGKITFQIVMAKKE
eukprot:sb/3468735/